MCVSSLCSIVVSVFVDPVLIVVNFLSVNSSIFSYKFYPANVNVHATKFARIPPITIAVPSGARPNRSPNTSRNVVINVKPTKGTKNSTTNPKGPITRTSANTKGTNNTTKRNKKTPARPKYRLHATFNKPTFVALLSFLLPFTFTRFKGTVILKQAVSNTVYVVMIGHMNK